MEFKTISKLIGVSMFIVSMPYARAELVFDANEMPQEQPKVQAQAPLGAQTQPQIVYVQQPAPVYVQTMPVQVAPAPTKLAKKAPVEALEEAPIQDSDEEAQVVESKKVKAEIRTNTKRTKTTRIDKEEENNDRLIDLIEKERLKHELKLAKKILGDDDEGKDETSPASAKAPVQDSVATKHAAPEEVAPAPAVTVTTSEPTGFKSSVRVTPMGGLSTYITDSYDVESKFATGVNIGSELFENISFEAEYIYAKYSLGMSQSTPYYSSYTPYLNTISLNQNVFDIGLKFFVFNKDARVRPFVGGGFSYTKTYASYDQNSMNYYASYYGPNMNQDYTSNSFAGFLQAGLEFQIAKNFSVGVLGRYFNTLSSRETAPVNNYALMTPGYYGSTTGYYGSYAAPVTASTSPAALAPGGKPLSSANFYQVLGTLTISF